MTVNSFIIYWEIVNWNGCMRILVATNDIESRIGVNCTQWQQNKKVGKQEF